jgi:serine/threonine-protein kinase
MTLTNIGRYEIQEELGRGAMAVVYKAVDPLIGRVVAIKTIRLEHNMGMKRDELRKRLYREAQSAGGLNHPNIVTIYDIGEEAEITYIAMEYIEGESLDSWMARHPIAPLDQTLSIVEQIASGLDYASVRGIIHRDIKPGNILLTGDCRPKIADFGIAKFTSSDLTMTGIIMGTPSYMSPEQATGKDLDGRSDLWSLGVIFYEMLTGERPFAGSNPTTIIYKIVHEEPTPPRKINVTLHPSFDYILGKMLHKDPTQRYQGSAEFIRDLRNYQNLGLMYSPSAPTVAMSALATAALPPPTPTAAIKPQRSYILHAVTALLVVAITVLSYFLYEQSRKPATPSPETKLAAQNPGPETKAVAPPPVPVSEKPAAVEPAPKETKKAEAPPKAAPARVQIRFSAQEYAATIYDGTRRLAEINPGASTVSIPAGTYKFRIASNEVYLDRDMGKVTLESDHVHPIVLPGLGSAYIELPNDAYSGCEILLDSKMLPTPYPAQIPKLAAGKHRLVFRWSGGKYSGTEFSSNFMALENNHILVTGDPKTSQAQVVTQSSR